MTFVALDMRPSESENKYLIVRLVPVHLFVKEQAAVD